MKTTIAGLIIVAALAGSACKQVEPVSQAQMPVYTGCTTDSDCEREEAEMIADTCEAITKSGKRCTRRVPEAGLLCKQHSKMVKAGKKVKTIK